MAQQVDVNTKAFEASAAIAQYARVVLASDGTVSTAGLTDKDIGVATREALAAGDIIAVRLRSGAGTHKAIAAEALAAGAAVHTAAGGRVADTATATGSRNSTAITAAAADGDIIEVLVNTHGDTANV